MTTIYEVDVQRRGKHVRTVRVAATSRTWLQDAAAQMGIPPRTLEQVRRTLAEAEQIGAADVMARLMCRDGNLTDEALLWIGDNYPAVWND